MPSHILLYSVNSFLAYRISQTYFGQRHYVWCAPYFDGEALGRLDGGQPPTSNPRDIYRRLHEDTGRGDLHSNEISRNKLGLKRGASKKREEGVIDSAMEADINTMLDLASAPDFRPLLYVIPWSLVAGMARPVDVRARAHPLSREYVIESLPRDCFDVLELG